MSLRTINDVIQFFRMFESHHHQRLFCLEGCRADANYTPAGGSGIQRRSKTSSITQGKPQ
ncbi:hypothetical protein BBF93_15935 [Hyphomonas sp. CACIAM 19H1]|uniref:hypothetical protein n=1 Tax=Hyphomonas sp. CACIAM 19H1 TaxID=1873716 RepID=UPI000DF07E94|nr:hypothetical protein [Hyphomonas sp. CACIAM 19H1]AXE65552.1 hypothetical protein BBF93_15935 [Hyphomonas sp. CACIAM 19H1]